MPISFDAATLSAAQTGVTSFSFTHTTAGSERGLFVGACEDTAVNIDSATYAGTGMTRQWHLSEPTFATRSAGFTLLAPASGANSVTVNYSASTNTRAGAISLNGVDSLGTAATNTGTASPATVNVTSVADDWVLDNAEAIGNASSPTVGAGQTQRYNGVFNAAGDAHILGSTEPATGASTTMSWTIPASVSWGIGGIAFKPFVASAALAWIVA